jgi:hypothetical protein
MPLRSDSDGNIGRINNAPLRIKVPQEALGIAPSTGRELRAAEEICRAKERVEKERVEREPTVS